MSDTQQGLQGNVLVVDDDDLNRQVISELLKRMNITPTTVASGGEAVEKASHDEFDLVLIDLHMPDMSGIEAIHKIIELNEDSPPIVVFTASTDPIELDKCMAAGARAVMKKTWNRKQLSNQLANWLTTPTSTEQKEINEEFLTKIRHIFFTELSEQHNQIIEAIDKGDMQQLRYETHKLRSSSAGLGYKELSEVTGKLEQAAIHNNTEAATSMRKELIQNISYVLKTR